MGAVHWIEVALAGVVSYSCALVEELEISRQDIAGWDLSESVW